MSIVVLVLLIFVHKLYPLNHQTAGMLLQVEQAAFFCTFNNDKITSNGCGVKSAASFIGKGHNKFNINNGDLTVTHQQTGLVWAFSTNRSMDPTFNDNSQRPIKITDRLFSIIPKE